MKVRFLAPKALCTIHTTEGVYLQHYDSVVAFRPTYSTNRTIELGEDYEYSRTTMKHVGQFLGCNIAEVRKNIASGKWKVNPQLATNSRTYEEVRDAIAKAKRKVIVTENMDEDINLDELFEELHTLIEETT